MLQQCLSERSLRLGRTMTISLLYLATIVNGLARRSLAYSTPVLVGLGRIAQEDGSALSALGIDGFAWGRLLGFPTVVMLGNKRTLMLNLAVLSLASAGYAFAGSCGQLGTQRACWWLLRVITAMTSSAMLPFLRNWFPREVYGVAWGFLQSGLQTGYLVASLLYSGRLLRKELGWAAPFAVASTLAAVLLVAIHMLLREKPPEGPDLGAPRYEELRKVQLAPLLRKFSRRYVFWGMTIAVAAYAPLVEYSSFVGHYLQEMSAEPSEETAAPAAEPSSLSVAPLAALARMALRFLPGRGEWVGGRWGAAPGGAAAEVQGGASCQSSALCEGRYRTYVTAYVASLVAGSHAYDRCSQLDKALLVLLLYLLNFGSWATLALSEPHWRSRADGTSWTLPLSSPVKTAVVAAAVASISIPSSLPFALFSLDFGKEGAAILSSFLSAVGFLTAKAFIKHYPALKRSRGWHGIYASLASLSLLAAASMCSIMFADQRKFARGYIIRSSILNETVVTLHACSRESCEHRPMWRPGSLRRWGGRAGLRLNSLRRALYAPSRRCARCGRASVLECKVGESFAELALRTPFSKCNESDWIRSSAPLRKGPAGWDFADPTRYPLAPRNTQWKPTYGDQEAFQVG